MTFEGEYFGSAPTKRCTWSQSLPIASNSKLYISLISKHTFFKKLMNSVTKKKISVLQTKKKPCDILYYIHNGLRVLVPFTVQM